MILLINKILALFGLRLQKLNLEIMDGLFLNNPGRLTDYLGINPKAAEYVMKYLNADVLDGEIRRYNYKEYFKIVKAHLIKNHFVEEYIEDIKTIFDYLVNYYEEYFEQEDSKRFEKLMTYYKCNNLSFPY